jgi:hypothetical protein
MLSRALTQGIWNVPLVIKIVAAICMMDAKSIYNQIPITAANVITNALKASHVLTAVVRFPASVARKTAVVNVSASHPYTSRTVQKLAH